MDVAIHHLTGAYHAFFARLERYGLGSGVMIAETVQPTDDAMISLVMNPADHLGTVSKPRQFIVGRDGDGHVCPYLMGAAKKRHDEKK